MIVTYEHALEALSERLGPDALSHSESTADMAALLATVYGCDVEAARIAGLLHDWDREVDRDQLVELALSRGLAVTDADRRVPYLLHGRTAIHGIEKTLPGIPQTVLRAIARHTTGALSMTELDMIVYVADMIEPQRAYPGVDDLREAVGTLSLDMLFVACYASSVGHLVRDRRPIHPVTVEVWNSYVAKGSL